MDGESHWQAMFGLVRPHRNRVAVMVTVLAIAGALPLIGPLLIAAFIDEAQNTTSSDRLLTIAGAYVVVGLVRQLLSIAVAWTATDLAWRVTNELRTSLARHVLGLDLSFHRGTSPGELVSRVDGDVTALSDFVARFAVKAAAAVVTLAGLVVVLLFRDWRVGLGLAVYLAAAIFVLFLLRNKAVHEAATEQAATGRLLGEIEERLTGADDLRSNGGGSHAVATFQRASAAVLRSALAREKQGVMLWIMSNAVFVIGGLAAIAIDAALLRRNAITLGTAYLIFQYTQILRAPLSDLSDETERVQRAAGGMARTLQLIDEDSGIKDDGVHSLPNGPLRLDLEAVSFSYADEDDPVPVLTALDLHLPPGRSIGVLGRTGSGKTTLARLLLRLVEPTHGTVRFGEVDIQQVPLVELRSRTGVVSQDVHLFSASIRDNLTLFDDTISDARLKEALAALDLLPWVEAMPDGLGTKLGPSGSGLSAGEGQLIALTRLFLRSPDFVLLDEASSRIDPLTEERVTHAIDKLLEGRTALVIAHRLSTVERLDEILVLDRGEIVEHGPTTQLRSDPESRYSQLLAVGLDAEIDEVSS